MQVDFGGYGGFIRPDGRARLYDQAARLSPFGGWETDLATGETTWTDGVYHMFGLPLGLRLRRSDVLALYSDESRADIEVLRSNALRTGCGFSLDAEIRNGRGERRWIRVCAEVAQHDGRTLRLYGAKQDITGQLSAMARLRLLSECDFLTGLGNRRLFDTCFRALINGASSCDGLSALVLIDVDHFKQINDTLGHAAGDECLRQLASRLRDIFADAHLVARIGGDEFAVLLRATMPPLQIARRLREASQMLRRPFLWQQRLVAVHASIGARMVAYPAVSDASDLFMEADGALYAAKEAGRDRIEIFGISSGATWCADGAQTKAMPDQAARQARRQAAHQASGRLDRDPPGLVRAASFRT